MSGDWIKMRGNLWDDPRITRMCDATGNSEATIVGACYWLWATADQHSDTGTMPGLSLAAIDRKTGVKGFAQAMVDAGWLAESPGGVQLLRFEDHNGASAKKRSQTARRVAAHRSNDHVTQEDEYCNASSVTPALAREEKRREKDKTASSSDDDSLPCPVGTLVDLYHECMPLNPQVRVLNDARKKIVRQRWKEAAKLDCAPFGYKTREQGLQAWRDFFMICAESDFLTGRAPSHAGKPPFIADIDFLFSPSGFAKTLENKYHREAA